MYKILCLLIYFSLIAPPVVWSLPIDVHSNDTHVVKSIETGTAAMQIRLEMIERAKKSIDVEYFIFSKSDATRIFVEALLRKKVQNPNIRIRVLIDFFALSKSLDGYYTNALIRKGIEFKHYNSTILLNLGKVTHRNHRKILLIDNKEAIVGGRNMGDEYYDLKPKFNFMDRDVWLKGPIAKVISESFGHFWEATQSKVPLEPRRPTPNHNQKGVGNNYQAQLMRHKRQLKEAENFAQLFNNNDQEGSRLLKMKAAFKRIGKRLLDLEPTFEVNSIRFLADGPNWKDSTHSVSGPAYYEIMERAQNTIAIETPYFYLQKEEKAAFERIKNKGVNVNLLLNAKKASNEFAINLISLHQGLDFSRMGFDLWLNEGRFMNPSDLVIPDNSSTALWMQHSKSMLVDDELTWIGTLNMDPRSIQRLNAELAVVIEDKAFNQAVKGHTYKRLSLGTQIKNGKVKKTGHDPAQYDSPLEFLRSSTTLPFYFFENQI